MNMANNSLTCVKCVFAEAEFVRPSSSNACNKVNRTVGMNAVSVGNADFYDSNFQLAWERQSSA